QTNLSAAGGGAGDLDLQPSVSPNGKRIAFTRFDPATGSAQIWVMRIDGSQQTDISNDGDTASESGPAWSEDGSKILFVKQSAGSFPRTGGAIWIRKANGKGVPHQLTAGPADANPAMSPDGDLLAFRRPVGGTRHLFVMKADGGGSPTDLVVGTKPDWSPDSTHLAYGQGGNGPIMVVNVSDPTDNQPLTGPGAEAPVWSPDGSQIAFMDCQSSPSPCQIALMSATGQNPHDITSDQTEHQKPDWQARNP